MSAKGVARSSLHILGSLVPGGIETWLLNIIRTDRRRELPIDVCLTNAQGERGPYATEFESLGGRIWQCPVTANLMWFKRRLAAIVRSGKYEIVHSHPHHFSGVVLQAAAKAGARVRVAHCHSDTSSLDHDASLSRRSYLAYTRWLIRRYATAGIACSVEAAESLFGQRWQADPRWQIMPCGIELTRFHESLSAKDLRRDFGYAPENIVLGHVGRFVPAKNHQLILDAFREAIKLNSNARLLLIGEGPLQEQVVARARDYGLSELVTFAGARSDVPQLMRGVMDVFVFPSLFEGLGVAVGEAQAAGLACVVSDRVPEAACLVPENYERLSLDQPAGEWAKRCLLAKPRIGAAECLRRVSESEMAIQRNVDVLRNLYAGARTD